MGSQRVGAAKHIDIDIQVVSISWLLLIMLLWTWECIYIFEMLISFPLDTYWEVGLQDPKTIPFFIFWGSFILFSIMEAPVYIPSNSCSVMSDSATPWTVAYQASLSMGFFRQEYWSGLPFPSPGDLPDPGIKPKSPALKADALPSEPPGKSHIFEMLI